MVAQLDFEYLRTAPTRALVRLLSYALFEGRPLTTRGRWFNPVVNAHLRLARQIGPRNVVRKPIFIVGMGRSGTTILGVVLSMHRQVAFLNEPKAMWHLVHPGEDVIGNYTQGPARYRLDETDALPDSIEAAQRMYGHYLSMTRRERVVDKYPELVFRASFVLKLFPDAKFIFLMRNGWDACSSIHGWSRRFRVQKNGEVHDWWGRNRRKWQLMLAELLGGDTVWDGLDMSLEDMEDDRNMAAVEWIVTMREGLRIKERFPDAVFSLRYEDLVTKPSDHLRALGYFCELEHDPVFLNYGERVLRSTKPYVPFALPKGLDELFNNVMRASGYEDKQ